MKNNLKLILQDAVLPFFFLTSFATTAFAEPDYGSCEYDASSLASAASDVESAKSNFESACNPYYGYIKDDEAACGPWGYERSSYDSAVSNFEDARISVEFSCEVGATGSRMLRQLIAENKHLKEEIEKLKGRKKP